MVQHLDFIASYDMLTGILNRRKFFTMSQALFDTHDNVCAIMIDIDRFKYINDDFGHHSGDIALKIISECIARNLPSEAIFGRLGGEEFAILMTDKDETTIMNLVEVMRNAVEKSEIIVENNTQVHCTISSGVAIKDDTVKTLDILLQKADKAMYEAKEKGRNRSIFRA
ncbi:MAG: GGDEF domain-containing protein [Sulfurospirillaceae bacterium]|nr:GGDEF domain-containing protein [Sulfurospirillaceae bacterium]